jgi:hypothetical protein
VTAGFQCWPWMLCHGVMRVALHIRRLRHGDIRDLRNIGPFDAVLIWFCYSAITATSDSEGSVRFDLPAQPIDATQALNLSSGVSNCKVSRGRSLSWRAEVFVASSHDPFHAVPYGPHELARVFMAPGSNFTLTGGWVIGASFLISSRATARAASAAAFNTTMASSLLRDLGSLQVHQKHFLDRAIYTGNLLCYWSDFRRLRIPLRLNWCKKPRLCRPSANRCWESSWMDGDNRRAKSEYEASRMSVANKASKSGASPAKSSSKKRTSSEPDDFISVARRLGADEDKTRFENMLGKIAAPTRSENPPLASAGKAQSRKRKTRSNRLA